MIFVSHRPELWCYLCNTDVDHVGLSAASVSKSWVSLSFPPPVRGGEAGADSELWGLGPDSWPQILTPTMSLPAGHHGEWLCTPHRGAAAQDFAVPAGGGQGPQAPGRPQTHHRALRTGTFRPLGRPDWFLGFSRNLKYWQAGESSPFCTLFHQSNYKKFAHIFKRSFFVCERVWKVHFQKCQGWLWS